MYQCQYKPAFRANIQNSTSSIRINEYVVYLYVPLINGISHQKKTGHFYIPKITVQYKPIFTELRAKFLDHRSDVTLERKANEFV